MVDVKSGTEDHLHQKYVNIKNYENNDSLSICRIRLVQGKPQLGHAKPRQGGMQPAGRRSDKAGLKPL